MSIDGLLDVSPQYSSKTLGGMGGARIGLCGGVINSIIDCLLKGFLLGRGVLGLFENIFEKALSEIPSLNWSSERSMKNSSLLR